MTQTAKLPYPETPELDRMKAIRDESQAQGAFLDWLMHEKKIDLCRWWEPGEDDESGEGEQYLPITDRIETLLAEYHDIDLDKVEKERRLILETIQQHNDVDQPVAAGSD